MISIKRSILTLALAAGLVVGMAAPSYASWEPCEIVFSEEVCQEVDDTVPEVGTPEEIKDGLAATIQYLYDETKYQYEELKCQLPPGCAE